MSTIQDIVNGVRLEMTDEQATRWTDAQAVLIISKAIRRINTLLHRNDIEVGRKYVDFTLAAGGTEQALPSDFMTPYSLTRTDNHAPLTQYQAGSWDQIVSAAECTAYMVSTEDDVLYIGGAPTAAVAMRFRYWPRMDLGSFALNTTCPWGGRFDDLIAEYAALRLKNIDEMDVSTDTQLLQDLENNILDVYATVEPETVTRRGWLV